MIMAEEEDMMSEENTPVHSDDGAGPPRKPDGDPDPDGPHIVKIDLPTKKR